MKKQSFITILFTLLMSMTGAKTFAHDIAVANADGVIIYYSWINNKTELAVCFQGYGIYWANEYSGNVMIPESVVYEGNTYSVTSIGREAFLGCSSLTSVTIPNSVTSIGSSAFQGCSSLNSVTIGNGVISIGGGTFSGCSGLTSVTIPNSVTSIGEYAFNGCSGLTSIAIPNSVTSIGNGAFENCSSLTSVTIPNSVTSIGSSAFNYCYGLSSVTIPNSVTSIGNGAFSGCSGLTSVTICNSVESIGNYAFYGCTKIEEVSFDCEIVFSLFSGFSSINKVTLSENVKTIVSSAFSGCSGLSSVTIPNSVTSIGNNAFSGCTGLTSVNISDVAAWCNIKFSDFNANPLYYAHHLYLNDEEIVDLVIPNDVTSINREAFSGCSGLTSVTIPNSVTSIGDYAFNYCYGLSSVTIPNSVTSIGDYAFNYCYGLSSVTIPNSVTTIGVCAFSNCSGLTSVAIPNSVTSIVGGTFYKCSGLTSVTIPNSVASIGREAFLGCSSLTSLTIPNSVTSIGNGAFSGCSGLTSVTIGNSVESIGNYAFYNCSGLKEVYCYLETILSTPFNKDDVKNASLTVHDLLINDFKKNWPGFKKYNGLDKIDFKLVYYVDNEIYRTIYYKYDETIVPEEHPVKKGFTFSGWNDLPAIMPANDLNVTGTFSIIKATINNVIYQVTDAEKETVAVIGKDNIVNEICIVPSVDLDCTYKVTAIGDNIFNGCKDVKKIEICSNISTIGERAFANIDKLTDVTILAEDVPETDRTAFENSYIEDYVTLYVPAGSVDKYKAAAPWKNFKEVVAIEESGQEEPISSNKCATPTITFAEGKIKFACETEGVTFKYEITNADNFEGEGDEIEVGGVYNVSVYATKEYYIDSDKATMQIKLSTIKGDVNGDNKVDVSDHVALSNIIMGIQEEETEVEQEETE